jgi:hypothetical protein
MLAIPGRDEDRSPRGSAREAEGSAERWENEGGAAVIRVGAWEPRVVEHRAGWQDPTPSQTLALDLRQDVLMGAASPDGRPPTHRQRRLGWWWLGTGASVLALAGIAWAVIAGADRATVLAALGLILVLFVAAAPVWGAALLRGGEERSARGEARAELRADERPQARPLDGAPGESTNVESRDREEEQRLTAGVHA